MDRLRMRRHITRTLTVLGAVVLISAEPPRPSAPPPPPSVKPVSEVEPVAHAEADVMLGLIDAARRTARSIDDYTCTFSKQERVGDELLPAQTASMTVRHRPFGVHLKFAGPEKIAGREVVYVGGPEMRVKECGWKGAVGFVKVPIDDPRVKRENRHTIAEAGLYSLTEKIARHYVQNRPAVRTAAYQVGERVCTRVEMIDPNPKADYGARCVVYFDQQTHLPVRFEAYGRPTPEAPQGDLLELYMFHDLRFNVGITDAAFEK